MATEKHQCFNTSSCMVHFPANICWYLSGFRQMSKHDIWHVRMAFLTPNVAAAGLCAQGLPVSATMAEEASKARYHQCRIRSWAADNGVGHNTSNIIIIIIIIIIINININLNIHSNKNSTSTIFHNIKNQQRIGTPVFPYQKISRATYQRVRGKKKVYIIADHATRRLRIHTSGVKSQCCRNFMTSFQLEKTKWAWKRSLFSVKSAWKMDDFFPVWHLFIRRAFRPTCKRQLRRWLEPRCWGEFAFHQDEWRWRDRDISSM